MKFKLLEVRILEGSLIKLTSKELPVKTVYRKSILLSELGDISLTPVDLIRLDKLICESEEKIKD